MNTSVAQLKPKTFKLNYATNRLTHCVTKKRQVC